MAIFILTTSRKTFSIFVPLLHTACASIMQLLYVSVSVNEFILSFFPFILCECIKRYNNANIGLW